ncbi:MAG TPA: hypothetical protein PKA41_14800 [Verrucomicrobiota bacterium]|nr:hypothetical protein [Verrucomicrobiota bacterium]
MILEHKTRRRWFGLLCLLAAAAMLIIGEVALKGRLSAAGFLFYWLGCFGFTVLAVIAALIDIRSARLQNRRAQRELMEQTFGNIEPPRRDWN